MRQAYDYWQDQPGFYQRASPDERRPESHRTRVRLGVRELRRNRELTTPIQVSPWTASHFWSRPLFTRRNGTSGRNRITTSTEAPPPSEHGSERIHALRRRNHWGYPSGYEYVFPALGPRRNTPTTDTLKRPGPADQPGTIAPELLPDREANVNRSRKAEQRGQDRIARPPRRSGNSPGPARPPPRHETTGPPFLYTTSGPCSQQARSCETRNAAKKNHLGGQHPLIRIAPTHLGGAINSAEPGVKKGGRQKEREKE